MWEFDNWSVVSIGQDNHGEFPFGKSRDASAESARVATVPPFGLSDDELVPDDLLVGQRDDGTVQPSGVVLRA